MGRILVPDSYLGIRWLVRCLLQTAPLGKLARPAWINLFIKGNYLSTLKLNSAEGDAEHEFNQLNGDTNEVVLTFDFDYNNAALPGEVFLYLSSNFESKRGFACIFWRPPDGRELELRTTEVANLTYYDFINGNQYRRWVSDNPNFAAWFNPDDLTQNAPHYLLFADPSQPVPRVQQGTYQVVIDGFTFEEGSDIQAELVMLGQVYGAADTDFYRRNLTVPLLWRMPFALLIGLGGALSTTIISMALAAMRGGIFGSHFWMLQPITLLLLTGLGFSLFGFALERILNPRLSDD